MNKYITILLLTILQTIAAENLLLNPTFDFGDNCWTAVGHGFSTKAHPITKSNALHLNKKSEDVLTGATQSFIVKSHTPSIVSVSASSISEYVTGSGDYTLQVNIVDMNGKKTTSQTHFNNPKSWTTSSVQQIVPSVASVEVSLTLNNIGAVWFDDITATVEDFESYNHDAIRVVRSVDEYNSVDSMTATYGTDSYNIYMKYLILANAANDLRLSVAAQTFDSLGCQYEIKYPSKLNGASLALTNTDGSGKYLGIVFCTDTITGATAAQLQEVETYQVQFRVKKVVLYGAPKAADGVAVSTTKAANSASASLSFGAAAAAWIGGYNPSLTFAISDIWTYPCTITNANIATTAVQVTYSGDSNIYTAAAFITQTSGSKTLQFFLDQATWSTHSVGLGSFWLQWMSNNLYLGSRRLFMNLHVDDLFSESNTWDTVNKVSSEDVTYRITPTELTNFAIYLNNTNKNLAAGSNVTVSFPFNGEGVTDAGGFTKDKLFIAAKSLIWSYVFEQHSYTHPEFDKLTYAQTRKEVEKDLVTTTIQLFGSYNHPRYSNNSMVTPSISGIFNGNALRALWDLGIRHIVGDNSRPELNPPFWWHGWYTNTTKNGFAGMHVVPREATYIYYDCSNAAQEEGEYNYFYKSYYGKDSTLAEIVAREGVRIVNLLFIYRNDAYMFHQGNLREFSYNGATTTLLGSWLDAVLKEYKKYFTLPLYGHNHQLLSQKFVNREQRDACGFTGYVTVNTASKQIVSVSGSSTGICDIGITGAAPATAQGKYTTETYGSDITTWINMRSSDNPFTFLLRSPISL